MERYYLNWGECPGLSKQKREKKEGQSDGFLRLRNIVLGLTKSALCKYQNKLANIILEST